MDAFFGIFHCALAARPFRFVKSPVCPRNYIIIFLNIQQVPCLYILWLCCCYVPNKQAFYAAIIGHPISYFSFARDGSALNEPFGYIYFILYYMYYVHKSAHQANPISFSQTSAEWKTILRPARNGITRFLVLSSKRTRYDWMLKTLKMPTKIWWYLSPSIPPKRWNFYIYFYFVYDESDRKIHT